MKYKLPVHKREDSTFFNAFKQNAIRTGTPILVGRTTYVRSPKGTMVRIFSG